MQMCSSKNYAWKKSNRRGGLLFNDVVFDFLAGVFVAAEDLVGALFDLAPDDAEDDAEGDEDAGDGLHGVGHDGGVDVGECHGGLPFLGFLFGNEGLEDVSACGLAGMADIEIIFAQGRFDPIGEFVWPGKHGVDDGGGFRQNVGWID